jgi:hypothetical protein
LHSLTLDMLVLAVQIVFFDGDIGKSCQVSPHHDAPSVTSRY